MTVSLDDRRVHFAAALASGALFALANMLEPWWPAAWIAPIPLLLAAFRASNREAALLAAMASLMGVAGVAGY